jgi:hypothetical protein
MVTVTKKMKTSNETISTRIQRSQGSRHMEDNCGIEGGGNTFLSFDSIYRLNYKGKNGHALEGYLSTDTADMYVHLLAHEGSNCNSTVTLFSTTFWTTGSTERTLKEVSVC